MADKDNTKTCETCFHEKTHFNDPPCNTCAFNYGSGAPEHWAAKPEVFWAEKPAPKALDVQVAGDHYKGLKIQPIEYIHANKMNYCEANVVKYITRWRDKGGLKDLEKVKHYVDLLIELEGLHEASEKE